MQWLSTLVKLPYSEQPILRPQNFSCGATAMRTVTCNTRSQIAPPGGTAIAASTRLLCRSENASCPRVLGWIHSLARAWDVIFMPDECR